MKKKLAFILAAVMMISCAAPAYVVAETKTTEFSLEVDPALESYTIEIPATVVVDPTTKSGECNVIISEVSLVWSEAVEVRVAPTNATTEGLYLVNSENPELKIAYGIFSGKEYEENGTLVEITTADGYKYKVLDRLPAGKTDFLVGKATGNETITMSLEAFGDYPGGGTYTDTWTFTISMS